MDKNYAIKLIQDVFQNPFNRDRFVAFSKNLFNFLDTERHFIYRGNFIPDAYKPYIHTLERIGKYEDAEGNKIDVLIVHLKKEHSIEHARTMQRNFIAWYLSGSRGGELKDAALVAFHTDNPDDWRFSLVKMDYQIVESETGKIKTKTELTPARRFSFLVGKNENSHTAQRQLLPTLQDDKNNPLLSDFEKAFNIEVVTQEFFEKYKKLFFDVKEALEKIIKKSPAITQDFEEKGVDPVDFSKKLLGQIVFLYFLQKKGWFGVERDSNWGTGPKNFLRLLFEKMIADYKNFFNDILEPLFYEALAKERDKDFYSRFNCKIPFLNGGLFDPISDYDWVHTDILLPDDLFSNHVKTKEGDIGTGILDILDRYNFTVKEDEPLEKEVAVDPEMLGKVFENLLEVKDRKSKGTYYTPREIVHYMCQESLINYLVNELSSCHSRESGNPVPTRKDIETLIQYGESAVEHDGRVEQEGKETETYSYKLPESIRKNAQLIDDKLKNIRVCDPAIGSGAFPVGMMNEIIRTRNTLTNYIHPSRHSERSEESRTIYNFKRDAIQNSLYGVDIDPGAVEIAKLRLWLSLVVDEEERKTIQPLPNLDYKIMQGNSLLEEFEGIELFDESLIAQLGLFDEFSEAKQKANELKKLHKEFFEASQKTKKDELKKRIENLEWELIETTLKEQNKVSTLKQLEQYKKSNIKPFFLWKLHFSEVFHEKEKKGFDVVIANPPYVRQEDIKKYKLLFQRARYKVYNSTSDLYTYFYELSYNILAPNRFSCFISSNKWMRAKYGEKLRNFFRTNTKVINLIDFNGHKVFEATVDTNIMLFQKCEPKNNYRLPYSNIDPDFTGENLDNYVRAKQQTVKQCELSDSGWTLADDKVLALKKKIEKIGTSLKSWGLKSYMGIKTGFNEAFIINEQKKKELLKRDVKNSNIIRSLLKGKDVERYATVFNNRYLILAKNGINIKQKFPSIFEHLLQFKVQLEKRWDKGKHWSNLRDCNYYVEFETVKIVYPDINKRLSFAYDSSGYYSDNTSYILGTNNKYILSILNSSLINFYYGFISSQLGNGAIRHFTIYIERIPIKQLSEREQKPFIDLVDKIMNLKKSDSGIDKLKVLDYEKQIDQLVYKLYGLTPEEITVVENKKG